MERHGFRYWVTPKDPIPGYRGLNRQFPYVLDDVGWAKRHGYGSDLQRRRDAIAAADPNRKYYANLPDRRRAAAIRAINGARPVGLEAALPNGMPVRRSDRGCRSEAQRELYGDLPAWFRVTRLTDNLPGARFGMVVQDRRYAAAVTAWSRCMRSKGHSYAGPAETRSRFFGAAPSSLPRDAEIRLAVAEATCAHSSGLADTARRLDATYEERLRKRFHAELSDRRRLERDALPRAQAIVAGG